MGLSLDSLRVSLREGIGIEGDDTQTLPNTDSATKTGTDTYLNRSFWELLAKFPFKEKEKSEVLQTASGIQFIAASASFEAIQGISVEDPVSFQHTPLDRITIDDYEQKYINEASNQGKPEKYFRRNDAAASNIHLWPTPDAVYDLTVYSLIELADIVGEPVLDRNWHEIILFGAQWRALIQVNGDYARAREVKAQQSALIAGLEPIEQKEERDSHRSGVEVLGMEYDQQ